MLARFPSREKAATPAVPDGARLAQLGRQLRTAFAVPRNDLFSDLLAALDAAERARAGQPVPVLRLVPAA